MATNDKYAELRAALDARPTPGPWVARGFGGVQPNAGGPLIAVTVTNSGPLPSYKTNAAYIAAADPEAIRALLAERDSMRRALLWNAAALQACCAEGIREASTITIDAEAKTFCEILDIADAALTQQERA